MNLSALAKPLGVDSKTIDRWLTLFEQMFVLRRVRAWHRNDLKRLKESAGNVFACGIVTHDGERIQRVGDGFFAMSFSQLHEASRTG